MTLISPNDDHRVWECNPHMFEVQIRDGQINLLVTKTGGADDGKSVNLRYNADQATHLAIGLLRAAGALGTFEVQ